MLRGSIVHSALETIDFANPQPPPPDAIRELTDSPLTDAEVAEIQAFVAAFANSPLSQRLARASRVVREAGFAFALDADGAGPLVSGYVDVIAREAGGAALVVDYKTDHLLEGETPAELVARGYETQRLVYALAALRDGAHSVEVAYCLLERPDEPVTTTFTQADAPDLAGRLSDLAQGVIAHEYPVTDTPHRELCGDCPGRQALCSWPQADTLRPRPAPSPAAPARRS